jgi:hypothetical protein
MTITEAEQQELVDFIESEKQGMGSITKEWHFEEKR